MCKNKTAQRHAYESLKDSLRDESIVEIRGIYERRDNALDLVGFFAALADGVANFFRVDERDEVHVCDLIPYYRGMGHRTVARKWGNEHSRIRTLYSI